MVLELPYHSCGYFAGPPELGGSQKNLAVGDPEPSGCGLSVEHYGCGNIGLAGTDSYLTLSLVSPVPGSLVTVNLDQGGQCPATTCTPSCNGWPY